jgi:hypothetical protein
MARKRRWADCIGPAGIEGQGRENRPRAAKKEATVASTDVKKPARRLAYSG